MDKTMDKPQRLRRSSHAVESRYGAVHDGDVKFALLRSWSS